MPLAYTSAKLLRKVAILIRVLWRLVGLWVFQLRRNIAAKMADHSIEQSYKLAEVSVACYDKY